MSKIFIIPFHVTRMETSIMPSQLAGGYVSCYTLADDYVDATTRSLQRLKDDGLYPKEILQPVQEMATESWSAHVKETFPGHEDRLPTQVEFETTVADGGVVYGAFASYE
jgi:hypothetical protein